MLHLLAEVVVPINNLCCFLQTRSLNELQLDNFKVATGHNKTAPQGKRKSPQS